MTSDAIVAGGAVRAAWDSYRILENRTPDEERRQAQRRLRAAMDTYGRDEVSRGSVFLAGVLTAHIVGLEEDGEEDRIDPLGDLIPAVVRKLPGFELADPAQVPMVTGVLMAAAMGMDTVAWRDRFGPIPPAEALATPSRSGCSPTSSTTSPNSPAPPTCSCGRLSTPSSAKLVDSRLPHPAGQRPAQRRIRQDDFS
ncbi:hypothetical protein [Streptomyces sp. NPDC005435]|uniref:hypothetical protein n=1 Tax=Streptomyces sp. NPDC005435 TaxID=3154464 RepID=UPI0034560C5B